MVEYMIMDFTITSWSSLCFWLLWHVGFIKITRDGVPIVPKSERLVPVTKEQYTVRGQPWPRHD